MQLCLMQSPDSLASLFGASKATQSQCPFVGLFLCCLCLGCLVTVGAEVCMWQGSRRCSELKARSCVVLGQALLARTVGGLIPVSIPKGNWHTQVAVW